MRAALFTIGLAGLAMPLAAGEKRTPPPGAFTALTACRAIADPAAKLACFEEATAKMEAALAANELYMVDKKQVRETRRTLFGLPIPNIGRIFGGDGRDEEKEEFKEIATTLTSVSDLGYGKLRMTTKEDAVWETTELMKFPFRNGQAVEIRKGLAGGFMMKGGSKLVRVKRVR